MTPGGQINLTLPAFGCFHNFFPTTVTRFLNESYEYLLRILCSILKKRNKLNLSNAFPRNVSILEHYPRPDTFPSTDTRCLMDKASQTWCFCQRTLLSVLPPFFEKL